MTNTSLGRKKRGGNHARGQHLFITHGNPNNRSKTEFVAFLVYDHATSCKDWDLWLDTPEGQKLNQEWQSIAQCDMKMPTFFC